MELRHIRYFMAVAQRRNFTQAAKALYISQPSLSQQIQQLEREMGVLLLQRTKRSVQLTPAGEAFLLYAEQILTMTQQAHNAMQAYRQGLVGTVTLGMLTSLRILQMPALLGSFRRRYPGINMVLREGTARQLVELLHRQQVDAIIVCTMDEQMPESLVNPHWAMEEILRENLGVLVAPDHALAARATITWEALRAMPLVVMQSGSGLHDTIMRLSRDAGFAPHIAYESGDSATICTLVAEGLGAALVPASLAQQGTEPLRWLPFAQPAPFRSIQFVWPKVGQSAVSRAWSDFFRATIDDVMRHRGES